jgi:hypothetical protein
MFLTISSIQLTKKPSQDANSLEINLLLLFVALRALL